MLKHDPDPELDPNKPWSDGKPNPNKRGPVLPVNGSNGEVTVLDPNGKPLKTG